MLIELAIHFRYMQLLAHNAHNLTSGPTFFENHEFFGELYPVYEAAYDSLVERCIGLGDEDIDLVEVQKRAAAMLEDGEPFNTLFIGEEVIQQIVEKCFEEDDYTQGTLNLLAQLADDSEVRTYKLKQKLNL